MLTPRGDRLGGLVAESRDGAGHPLRALVDRPGDVDGVGAEDLASRPGGASRARALRRMGWSIASWWACSGFSSRGCAPSPRRSQLMTTSSRIGSIGGLVTWAKSCLK